MKTKQSQKNVTIIGDTSSFHMGSYVNYKNFKKLVNTKYNVLQEIHYKAFGIDFSSFNDFYKELKKSKWMDGLKKSDIFIVHGEGLTEKKEDFAFKYLYFCKI